MPRLTARPPAAGPPPLTGLLTGQVVTWDATSGFMVLAAGATVAASAVLTSAGPLTPGDLVAVLRHKSTVLVLGKITAPG